MQCNDFTLSIQKIQHDKTGFGTCSSVTFSEQAKEVDTVVLMCPTTRPQTVYKACGFAPLRLNHLISDMSFKDTKTASTRLWQQLI